MELLNLSGSDGDFTVETNVGTFCSKKVILATGIMDNPRPLFWYFKFQNMRRYISSERIEKKNILVVVGGGDAAAITILQYYKNNQISWVFRSSLSQMKYNIFRHWKKNLNSSTSYKYLFKTKHK